MEKKITVSFTLDELSYLCNTIYLHEYNKDDEEYIEDKEHSIFLNNMSLKLVKRYESSGYETNSTRILKNHANHIKKLLNKQNKK
jgi:hypothetical protein